MTINDSKTCIWSRGEAAPLPASLADRQKSELWVLEADIRFLGRQKDRDVFGAPVWGSVAGGPLVDAARHFAQRLAALQDAGLRGKTAYTVLHTCFQGCCNHLLRANYEEGGWVDDLEVFQDAMARITRDNLVANQRALAPLPLKDGGLAFRGFRWHASLAFLGSWGLVIQEVAAGLGASSLEGCSSRCPKVWADIGGAGLAGPWGQWG